MSDKSVSLCEEQTSQKRVLDDSHDGLVRLRIHDLFGHEHDLLNFCDGFVALWHVHVHLVTIEVCVVRSSDTEIHPERLMRQYLDSMSHDRHLMKRWLAVKYDIVSVFDVALDFITNLNVRIRSVPQTRQINLLFIMANDVLCSWPILWTILDEFFHLIIIVWSDSFRESHIGCNLIWDSKLLKCEIGIWCNNRSR